MTKIAIRVCSHLFFLETGSDTEAIYFADSAMIVHVVPESAEVSSCGPSEYIYRELLYNVYGGVRVTDVPCIIIIRS